jgi:hypothetical protein
MILTLLALLTQDVNPRYELWADCKPESWVKVRMVMKSPQGEMTSESVTKLLEVTPEKAVVETNAKMKLGEREMTMPPKKEDVTKAPDPKNTIKPSDKGEEEVTVAGKTFKCKIWEMEQEQGGQKIKGRIWITKEIPGGMAKAEFTGAQLSEPMKMEAVEWEKKK